jgi:hypothetical protein
MSSFAALDAQRAELMKSHPDWRIWYVPNAVDGSVMWCAQREPTIHAYSAEDLAKDIALPSLPAVVRHPLLSNY